MGVNGGSVATNSGAGEMSSGCRGVSGVAVYAFLAGEDECASVVVGEGSCCDASVGGGVLFGSSGWGCKMSAAARADERV